MRTDTISPPATTLLAALAAAAAVVFAPAAPAAAQSACGAYYTVDTGDSLLEIAQRCGVTVPALLAANPGVADERDLEVNDRLRVPDPAAPAPTPLDACGTGYTVRTGDTLTEIAQKCGLTVPLLVAANPPLPDPLGIHDGLRIQIPNIPAEAAIDPATIAVAAPAEPAEAAADTAAETSADTAAAPAVELDRVEGTLEAGPRCMRVRTDGGELVAIAGQVHAELEPGARVVLLGIPAQEDDCAAERVFQLRILYRAPRP